MKTNLQSEEKRFDYYFNSIIAGEGYLPNTLIFPRKNKNPLIIYINAQKSIAAMKKSTILSKIAGP
jgi:hypothetical protein